MHFPLGLYFTSLSWKSAVVFLPTYKPRVGLTKISILLCLKELASGIQKRVKTL